MVLAGRASDMPVSTELRIHLADPAGPVVADVWSGTDGHFSTALAPAEYVVRPQPELPTDLQTGRAMVVRVRLHEFEQVTIVLHLSATG